MFAFRYQGRQRSTVKSGHPGLSALTHTGGQQNPNVTLVGQYPNNHYQQQHFVHKNTKYIDCLITDNYSTLQSQAAYASD